LQEGDLLDGGIFRVHQSLKAKVVVIGGAFSHLSTLDNYAVRVMTEMALPLFERPSQITGCVARSQVMRRKREPR
jgi:hypothetical protein